MLVSRTNSRPFVANDSELPLLASYLLQPFSHPLFLGSRPSHPYYSPFTPLVYRLPYLSPGSRPWPPCFWFWPYSHFLDLPLFTTGPKVFFVYIIIDFSLNNRSKVYYNTILNQVYSFTHFGPYSHNGWDQDRQSQTLSAFCN